MRYGPSQPKTVIQSYSPVQSLLLNQPYSFNQNNLIQKVPLRILIVSWNMASRLQPIEEVAKLLSPSRLSQHDLVVIGTKS
jgi:hypothetical protein